MVQAEARERNGSVSAAPANPKEHEQRTQALLRNLYDASASEFMTPSTGDPYVVPRDPHLRLRRTLTPSLNKGLPKYSEAQFMLSKAETTGRRESLRFGVSFDGSATTKQFVMDAYAWGASEEEAQVRVVAIHGISPGVSRTRWHANAGLYEGSTATKVRFVALDWHSIDRSVDDDGNDEFLTCLPKHIFSAPSSAEEADTLLHLFESEERRERGRKLLHAVSSGLCPRSMDDGAKILRAVIEDGLKWGAADRPFVLGLKSWSGGVGMRMLSHLARGKTEEDVSLAENVRGAVLMHPGCFDAREISEVMSSGILPDALLCWAKDDPLVPYAASRMYLDAAAKGETRARLVTYERGGHHNFDGSGGLPNFDLEVRDWIDEISTASEVGPSPVPIQ